MNLSFQHQAVAEFRFSPMLGHPAFRIEELKNLSLWIDETPGRSERPSFRLSGLG